MPSTAVAQAYPKKQFFLDMFTRDISLEDCMLDLIDNSLDSLLLKNKVNIGSLIFGKNGSTSADGSVGVTCSEDSIRVKDDCGGIEFSDARDNVFCFGHDRNAHLGRLGAYGIGLKRAMFKIGDQIEIKSQTTKSGFEMSLDVPSWSDSPDS